MSANLNEQAVAEQWASTASEIKLADETLRRAENDSERLRSRLTTLSEQLAKCVGPNVPTKAFKVAHSEVVIVEHGQAIKLVEFEKT